MDMFVAEQRLVFRHARDICSFIAAHVVFIQLEGTRGHVEGSAHTVN
jgi:hypothetical protein